jgi:5'-phosphate synthase pdxT subunit
VFIRAPVIERVGADVDVLAEHNDRPVVVREGNIIAATFHPELAGEGGLHRLLVEGMR